MSDQRQAKVALQALANMQLSADQFFALSDMVDRCQPDAVAALCAVCSHLIHASRMLSEVADLIARGGE